LAHCPRPRTQQLVFLALGAVIAFARPAAADNLSHITLLEENDSLPFNSDKHYTQGFRLGYLAPDLKPDSAWTAPFGIFDLLGTGQNVSRRYSFAFGQNIFTPKNGHLNPPDPKDRPYAGWLYGSVNLLQDTDARHLDHLELDLGVVGPAALGKQIQNGFHDLIGVGTFEGWHDQLKDEPGLVLVYDRSWHVPLLGNDNEGVDLVPETGATIGNVYDYAEIGSLLRMGWNLQADYGPNRIRPALSGTDYVNADRMQSRWGGYFFLGAQGRAVARNIFLQGNTFARSAHVGAKTFVGDLETGFSVYEYPGFRLDISAMRRSVEFQGQRAPDVLGIVAVSWSW
jgi:lipid A 3-O-deacylase